MIPEESILIWKVKIVNVFEKKVKPIETVSVSNNATYKSKLFEMEFLEP